MSNAVTRRAPLTTPSGAPFLLMLYGIQKVGKSLTVAGYAPHAAVIGPDTTVWDGARDWYGVGPRWTGSFDYRLAGARTIHDVIRVLPSLPADASLVVIEDFNVLTANTQQELSAKYANYDLIAMVRYQVFYLVAQLKRLPISTIVVAHEGKVEHTVRGRPVRGGPLLIGQLVEDIGLEFTGIIRMVLDPTSARRPVGSAFHTSPDPNWIQGFRGGIPHGAPGNLREGLRAAGYPTPYIRGLEWHDDVAEEIAVNALTGVREGKPLPLAIKAARTAALARHAARFDPDPSSGPYRHMRAALQAGGDRATVRLMQMRSVYADLGLDAPDTLGGGAAFGGFGGVVTAAGASAPSASASAPTTTATPAAALPDGAPAPNPFGPVAAPAPVGGSSA